MTTTPLSLIVLLLVAQSVLIQCGSHTRRRSSAATSIANGAHLFMETQSGEVLTRAARGASASADVSNPSGGIGLPSGTSTTTTSTKRTKNNKKLNKNFMPENDGGGHSGATGTSAGGSGGGGRKHNEKRLHNTGNVGGESKQQQQHGNRGGNNNKQQRQLLKSQQSHGSASNAGQDGTSQHPRKRAGGKSKQTEEHAEKTTNTEKSQSTCRYAKSAWTECDAKTNMRTRTLTLKKGESNCLPTRTMQKKCKRACRYEKGPWSECVAGQMTRQDKLKSTVEGGGSTLSSHPDAKCEAVRSINKKCNPGGGGGGAGANNNNKQQGRNNNKERKHKDKGTRRNTQQA